MDKMAAPFVSTDWLGRNLKNPKLVIVDARPSREYEAGHIPGAINSFFGAWVTERDGLSLELPADDHLLNLVGSLGIKPTSTIVVVTAADNSYSRADATRVAWTMIVAGLKNVSVLDGGFTKWLEEKRRVSIETAIPTPGTYKARVRRDVVVSKAYVMGKIGKATIVDARDAGVYFGVAIEPFAPRPGHIKGAVNLPTPWLYTALGTLLGRDDIGAMAANAVGNDKSKEIIVYCGVGGYASTWWFLLTRMLGYRNVKYYDGSAQDWAADPLAPMTRYKWR
ncbi:MAG: rhodanese-like domain-containing protein [Syntrophorhabdales bacterium]|jgi:thiosulfate/3-mercaptopyruvate sulfurtransferase